MRPGRVTEAYFTDQIIDLAHLTGWHVAHFRPARTAKGYRTPMQGDVGFPDIVLAKGGRVILAELKAEGGAPRPEQIAWLRAAWGDQWEAYLWRPRDLPRLLALLKETP